MFIVSMAVLVVMLFFREERCNGFLRRIAAKISPIKGSKPKYAPVPGEPGYLSATMKSAGLISLVELPRQQRSRGGEEGFLNEKERYVETGP